jgi:hypothetical protein
LLSHWGERRCLVTALLTTCAALASAAAGFGVDRPALQILGLVFATLAFGLGQPTLFSIVAGSGAREIAGARTGYVQFLFLYCGSVGAAVMGGLGPLVGPARAVLALLSVAIAAVVMASVVKPPP